MRWVRSSPPAALLAHRTLQLLVSCSARIFDRHWWECGVLANMHVEHVRDEFVYVQQIGAFRVDARTHTQTHRHFSPSHLIIALHRIVCSMGALDVGTTADFLSRSHTVASTALLIEPATIFFR